MKIIDYKVNFPEDTGLLLRTDFARTMEYARQMDVSDFEMRQLGAKFFNQKDESSQSVLVDMERYIAEYEQYRDTVVFVMVRRFQRALQEILEGKKQIRHGNLETISALGYPVDNITTEIRRRTETVWRLQIYSSTLERICDMNGIDIDNIPLESEERLKCDKFHDIQLALENWLGKSAIGSVDVDECHLRSERINRLYNFLERLKTVAIEPTSELRARTMQ